MANLKFKYIKGDELPADLEIGCLYFLEGPNKLYVVNSAGEAVDYTGLSEEEAIVISAALNDLNDRLTEVESADPVELPTFKTINGEELTGDGDIYVMTEDDEYVISKALNDLNKRVDGVGDVISEAIGNIKTVWEQGEYTSAVLANNDNHAHGDGAVAEGIGTSAHDIGAHTEGYQTKAGYYCHAEGNGSNADGNYSHAEGSSVALGYAAHAEGYSSKGIKTQLQLTGSRTSTFKVVNSDTSSVNVGDYMLNGNSAYIIVSKTNDSVTFDRTIYATWSGVRCSFYNGEGALAEYSHAEGYRTETTNPYEHAEGSFNASTYTSNTFGNPGNTIHSIGIGDMYTKKNAFEVMQNGDIYVYGLGGYTGKYSTDATRLQDLFGNSDLEGRVETVETTVETLETNVGTLETSINTLETTVDDNSLVVAAALNDLNNRITEIESTPSTLMWTNWPTE